MIHLNTCDYRNFATDTCSS